MKPKRNVIETPFTVTQVKLANSTLSLVKDWMLGRDLVQAEALGLLVEKGLMCDAQHEAKP